MTIKDELGRDAFFDHIYDYANRKLRMQSIDAGLRTTVLNAAGGIIEQRDGKGAIILHGYDDLNRPLRLWARDSQGEVLTVRERIEYGDGGISTQPAEERATNRAKYCLGKPVRHFDEAGLVEFDGYDFKGNLLQKARTVVSDQAILSVLNPPPPDWKVQPFRVNWSTPDAVALDPARYVSTITYDALNRIKLMTYPEDVESGRRRLRPHYNRAGALERVVMERPTQTEEVEANTFVERIVYDAKGQRALIAYGNGIMTRYAYDARTFRLVHLRSERYSQPAALTYHPTGDPLQSFAYKYDLSGNIVTIHDRASESGILNTDLGIDALDRGFCYDALYRLCSATGRECDLPGELPWDAGPRGTDLTKTQAYIENYRYDDAGNMTELKHLTNGTGFTRVFDMASGNNRLSTMTIASDQPASTQYAYMYDANGNMTQETTSRHFEWDHADRMKSFRTQVGTSEPSVHAHYLYDSAGQRVKKLVRKKGGQREVTIYVDGIFEHKRIVQGKAIQENNCLHVMDNQSRIAIVRVGKAFSDDNTPAGKYHFCDHLGSSNVVVGDDGNVINREEYTPYGETSFGSFSLKRYRFTGKEKDEESGLHYHVARYYHPWACRWVTCDPIGYADGTNLYNYVSANPIRLVDEKGHQAKDGPKNSSEYKSGELHATGDENWSKERRSHTRNADNKWSKDANTAATEGAEKRGDPPPSKTLKVTGGGVEAHHHADVDTSKKVGLNPKIAGEDNRMSAVYSRNDHPERTGTYGDDKLTHHNVAKQMDKYEQSRVPSTAAGVVDASATSKQRWPPTADFAERAKEQWKPDANHQQSPTVSLPTASGRTLSAQLSLKAYATISAIETIMKVIPKTIASTLAREGIRNFIPLAAELEDFLSNFGNPTEAATATAALLYLRTAAAQSLRAAGVQAAAIASATADALVKLGSRLTSPLILINFKLVDHGNEA